MSAHDPQTGLPYSYSITTLDAPLLPASPSDPAVSGTEAARPYLAPSAYQSPYLAASRAANLPYLASPYLANPYLANPYLSSPYVSDPYLSSPYVANPYLPAPYLSNPYLSSPYSPVAPRPLSYYNPYGTALGWPQQATQEDSKKE